jgi:hypothetical protein
MTVRKEKPDSTDAIVVGVHAPEWVVAIPYHYMCTQCFMHQEVSIHPGGDPPGIYLREYHRKDCPRREHNAEVVLVWSPELKKGGAHVPGDATGT